MVTTINERDLMQNFLQSKEYWDVVENEVFSIKRCTLKFNLKFRYKI